MRKLILVAAGAGAVLATPAYANTADLDVTATVEDSCTVSDTTMTFPTMSVVNGTNHDSSATVSLTCTLGADYNVSLDMGLQEDTGAGVRRLHDSTTGEYIPYDLYHTSVGGTLWDDTVVYDPAGTATGGADSFVVFGRIPSTAANVTAGTYTDTVTITIGF